MWLQSTSVSEHPSEASWPSTQCEQPTAVPTPCRRAARALASLLLSSIRYPPPVSAQAHCNYSQWSSGVIDLGQLKEESALGQVRSLLDKRVGAAVTVAFFTGAFCAVKSSSISGPGWCCKFASSAGSQLFVERLFLLRSVPRPWC